MIIRAFFRKRRESYNEAIKTKIKSLKDYTIYINQKGEKLDFDFNKIILLTTSQWSIRIDYPPIMGAGKTITFKNRDFSLSRTGA
jgi:hypothetical protein